MDTRYRNPADAPEAPTQAEGSNTAALSELRQRGRALADVGDSAIDNALSGNSRQFLQSSRQRGGQ